MVASFFFIFAHVMPLFFLIDFFFSAFLFFFFFWLVTPFVLEGDSDHRPTYASRLSAYLSESLKEAVFRLPLLTMV